MRTIVASKLYAKIEVGVPKQQIEIPLDFTSNEFFISDNPKVEFEQNNLFSDLKFYLFSESSSRKVYDEVLNYGENFYLAELCIESFFFNNSKSELYFYFPYSLISLESGGIGLLLEISNSTSTTDKEKSFFKQIKDKNFIKDYYWSIFFNTKNIEKEAEGFLLLGSLPHELETDLGYYNKTYFQKELKNLDAEMSKEYVLNKFKIDEIIVYEGNDENTTIEDLPINDVNIKLIELDYHSNGIQALLFYLKTIKTYS